MEFFRLGAEEKARFYQKILLEVGRLAPIMLIDADGNFIFASDAFLTDMGLEAEDLRHKSAYDLVAEKYYDRSPSLKALAEGKDCGELSESKDGFPVYTETKLLRNEQGEVEYALCHSLKPASIDHEVELLRHQVAYYRGEVAELKNRLRSGPQTIYQSEAMRRSIVTADRVAKADTAVMLTGESGVGKETVARYIHEKSGRSGRLVIINMASLQDELFESEFFGHEKGSFTGAMTSKPGLVEMAENGTLFLDEFTEASTRVQAKLLRVLQERCFHRVGGTQTISVNFRLIAASNRDITHAVRQGLFRADLYYRIAVINLKIPPLRERKADILAIARYYLHFFSHWHHRECVQDFSPENRRILESWSWPGNIRELRNVIEQSVVLTGGRHLTLPDPVEHTEASRGVGALGGGEMPEELFSGNPSLADLEKRYIERTLEQSGWRIEGKRGALAVLRISRSALYDKMRRYGVKRPF